MQNDSFSCKRNEKIIFFHLITTDGNLDQHFRRCVDILEDPFPLTVDMLPLPLPVSQDPAKARKRDFEPLILCS